jgi:Domain of unknown function (DUF4926)
MSFKELDSVALTVDMPTHGLKIGDVGAVVQVYPPEAILVEFVRADGRTQGVVMLPASQVRHVGARDILAVRQLDVA